MTLRPFYDSRHPDGPQVRRLIGIEVRVSDPYGSQEEIAVFPLDVELPVTPPHMSMMWNVTLHTTFGDSTTNKLPVP